MNTVDNSDYLAYADAKPTAGGDLARLADLANEQADAEAQVARIQAELNRAQERLKDISERQVPELMDQLGLETFKTRTGLVIEVDETIRASIPKARSVEAFAWLRAHNHEALIKREVVIQFSKGEDEKALALLEELNNKGLPAEDESSVHASTLSAWVREKLKKGEDVPVDLFGVFRQRRSKIKVAS